GRSSVACRSCRLLRASRFRTFSLLRLWTVPAQNGMEEFDSFGCDLITSRLHLPPDRCSPGNHFYIRGKGLDHHITLVTYSLQRSCDRLPIDMIVARRPAVTAARVEMAEVFARFADRRS